MVSALLEGLGLTSPRPADTQYHVFISYGRDVDLELAGEVQRGMQRLAKPWYRTRAMRVFRDETSLIPSSELWAQSIQPQLDASQYLLLLASERAAQSRWVDREVTRWLETKPLENLVIAKTDGILGWEGPDDGFRRDLATALPAPLADAIERSLTDPDRTPPLFVDLTWAREAARPLSTQPDYPAALAKLVAAVRPGMRPEDVVGEDVRLRRRTRRLARLAATGLAMLTAPASVAAIIARNERDTAVSEATAATSVALAADAQTNLASRPDVPILLALAALEPYHASARAPEAASNIMVASLEDARGDGLVGILHGHTNAVSSVAFSPNGRMLASGSADGTVRLWDLAHHTQLGRPLSARAGGGITSVAFSPDGRTVAAGSTDGEVRIWDLANHEPVGRPLTVSKSGGVTSIVFSRDGRTLASGSNNGSVALWNVATHNQLEQVSLPPVTNVQQGAQVETTYGVNSVAFTSDGRTLVLGSAGGTIWLWSLVTNSQLGQPLTVGSSVNGVAVSPDGRTLASADGDGRIGLWDLATEQPLGPPLNGHLAQVLTGAKTPVLGISFSPDGRTLASANGDGTVGLWDLATQKQLGRALAGPTTGGVAGAAFSPNGRTVASANDDGTVWLWDTVDHGQLGQRLISGTNGVASVSFSPDGSTFAAATDSGTVLLNLATRKPLGPPLIGDDSVAFSPNGRTLATGTSDGTLTLWNVATRKSLAQPLSGAGFDVTSVAFSPNGRSVASGSDDGTVTLWSVPKGKQLGRQLITTTNGIHSIAFSRNGQVLAGGTDDGTVWLWNVATHKQLGQPLTGPADSVDSVAVSPDGRTIAAGSADGTVWLWSLASHRRLGQPLNAYLGQPLNGQDRTVHGVALSPDGQILAAGSADGTVRVWDLATGKQLGQPLGHTNGVSSVAFSPDGLSLASGNYDGSVTLWSGFFWRNYAGLKDEACYLAGSGLDRADWAKYAPGIGYRKSCP